VIVATFQEWMGRNPTLIEDQVTYPIVTTFLGAPKVKTVRGFTMFGMSFVYVVFRTAPTSTGRARGWSSTCPRCAARCPKA
jgi:Cu/Ag efflux pump CusA